MLVLPLVNILNKTFWKQNDYLLSYVYIYIYQLNFLTTTKAA